ncbi:MAG: nucleotidyltransferase domain-containing protein [Candidatus Marinimicrobia bacterium]|nr:nucleotidyltransferase domain-containing protein [Candidatus Neomarinimicrobiota bacterium]
MIRDKKDILLAIKRNQDKILAFGVKRLGLFGSFVRKEQNVESDIDLLVEFDQNKKNFDNFIHLSFLLEELLEHHIELVTAESLSPYIKPHIIKEVEYVISRI